MSHLRIVCRRPPQPAEYPAIQIPASGHDCEVFVVSDDGTERLLQGVTDISWSCRLNEVAVATIKVEGVEIDAEGIVELTEATRVAHEGQREGA